MFLELDLMLKDFGRNKIFKMKPYLERQISENIFIRKFLNETDSNEYTWHIDLEDRIIKPLHETNWMIQFDNELPKKIQGEISIPKGIYHRVIKGSGDLEIELIKL